MMRTRAGTLVSALTRTALLAGLWWLIVQGSLNAWVIGLPAIAAAAFASMLLNGKELPRLSLSGFFRFLALFLRESVVGGIDVARRTLRPRLRINPGFTTYHLSLRDARARVLLINCIGLLPGTLSADCQGDHALLHLLDVGEDPERQIRRLEQAIADLFRLPLKIGDV